MIVSVVSGRSRKIYVHRTWQSKGHRDLTRVVSSRAVEWKLDWSRRKESRNDGADNLEDFCCEGREMGWQFG